LITDSNCEPSCRSVTRLAVDVLALKNASQFFVMAAVVAAVPAVLEAAGELEAGEDDAGGADELDELGLLLPQAARVPARAAAAQIPASREKYR
jgi:hypothetical protein